MTSGLQGRRCRRPGPRPAEDAGLKSCGQSHACHCGGPVEVACTSNSVFRGTRWFDRALIEVIDQPAHHARGLSARVAAVEPPDRPRHPVGDASRLRAADLPLPPWRPEPRPAHADQLSGRRRQGDRDARARRGPQGWSGTRRRAAAPGACKRARARVIVVSACRRRSVIASGRFLHRK
jgi:hypothetical protein